MWSFSATIFILVSQAVVVTRSEVEREAPAPVIFASSSSIFYHYNGSTWPILSGLRHAAVVDFWYDEGMLIWTEGHADVHVCRAPRGENILEAIPSCKDPNADVHVVKEQVNNTWGLAVDWVHSLLFRTDLAHDAIFVTDLRTMRERLLMESHMHDPEVVAVDPAMGLLFWKNFGHIERAGMDGLDRVVIVRSVLAQWWIGLALDLATRRVFWIEKAPGQPGNIYSTDYWGKNIRTLIRSRHVCHPFSLSVSAKWVYWTDWCGHTINAASMDGNEVIQLTTTTPIPWAVRVFDAASQPKSENVCRHNDCPGDSLCLPKSRLSATPSRRDRDTNDRLYSCMYANGTLVAGERDTSIKDSSSHALIASFLGIAVGCVAISVLYFFVVVQRRPRWIIQLGRRFFDGGTTAVTYDSSGNVGFNLTSRPSQG